MSGSQLLLLGGAQVVSDPNFEYTTLLLPGNGTNGAQNNTFLDSSTNNFTITRNGNTTQGAFSPFSQTGWGNFFDGSGDFLSVASSAAFDIGSSDFTVECWFNANSFATAFGLISRYDNAPAGWTLRVTSATNIRFVRGADIIFDATTTMSIGLWNHVAVVRSGTTLSIYHNGTRINQTTGISNFTDASTALQIGRTNTITDDINGYISNARVVKGTAVYSGATYTIPTAPLTAITNTSLLTCQSNRFIDNSSNAFAITVNGNTSIQAFSPFNPTAAWIAATNGGSGYYDGSGDYLTIANNVALQPGGGAFTYEAWVYCLSYPSAGNFETLWAQRATASGYGGPLVVINNSGTLLYYISNAAATNWQITGSSSGLTLPLNQWNHVAIVRNVNTCTIYLNGTAGTSVTLTENVGVGGNLSLMAGAADGSQAVDGYMSDFRLVKGTAVYTAAFTPPTAPLTAITNTSLLTSFTNAGIYDATSKNDLETVGNAQISTAQSKFGGSSIVLDGTGDYLLPSGAASNNLLALGSGDFTIEFWIRYGSLGDVTIIDWRPASTNGAYPTLFNDVGTNKLIYYANSATRITSSTVFATNTWYHVAIVRYSGSTKMYVNGVNEGSAYSDANNYLSGALRPMIGANGSGNGSNAMNGFIQDLRITKGVARYTANFTAPTAAFPLL
jgi:hypothetical protein